MAKVVWATGIDTVGGALTKPKKNSVGHSCGSYLIGKHRTAPTTNPNCSSLFIQNKDTYKRTTPLTADELTARELFRARARWIKTRMEDLSHVTSDQADFIAQKNEPGGAKTLKAYYWKMAKAQIDEDSLNG